MDQQICPWFETPRYKSSLGISGCHQVSDLFPWFPPVASSDPTLAHYVSTPWATDMQLCSSPLQLLLYIVTFQEIIQEIIHLDL